MLTVFDLNSWDNVYAKDIETHSVLPSHKGTTWFDDNGAEERTLSFLDSYVVEDLGVDSSAATVLDLGTGNASMLMLLRENGWTGNMWGIDYSQPSIDLAEKLLHEWSQIEADGEELTERSKDDIHLLCHDLLSDDVPSNFPDDGFDVVLDKGTFDAISLSEIPEGALPEQDPVRMYRPKVEKLVKKGSGLLLITSCNWTSDELKNWMSGGELEWIKDVKYPTFKFGGVEGSQLAAVCWRRKP